MALFAPYNALMLFSGVPSKPLPVRRFPALDVLKDNWQEIREEAMPHSTKAISDTLEER